MVSEQENAGPCFYLTRLTSVVDVANLATVVLSRLPTVQAASLAQQYKLSRRIRQGAFSRATRG